MSDTPKEPAAGDSAASSLPPPPGAAAQSPPPPPPEAATAVVPPRPRFARPAAAGWLALLLAVVVIGGLLSPLWAPGIALLLPWGGKPVQQLDKLAARVTALEARPAPPQVDLGPLASAQAALARRVAALETLTAALHRNEAAEAAVRADLAALGQRFDAAGAKADARAKTDDAAFDQLRREMAQRSAAAADLGQRLAALEQQVATEGAAGRRGAALLLALLEMREAVANARPFPQEYAAFEALAAKDADIVAAARPLAAAANAGVASNARLRQGLADLADRIAIVKPQPAGNGWWARILARLRGLVTVRRIDSAAKAGPEAAIAKAQAALAEGNLAGAVAQAETLAGADADAARPWLAVARQRLAAETALARVQQIATARLAAAPPASATPPAPTPSAAPRAPPSAPPLAPSAPAAAPKAPS